MISQLFLMVNRNNANTILRAQFQFDYPVKVSYYTQQYITWHIIMSKKNTKVIVGLSGGVDSSVAAYLLLEQGYEVEGLFMKNWEQDDTDSYCAAAEDIKDVESVCAKLKIKLHIANFAQNYWDQVFNYFLSEYNAGRTPNPDILCNKEIKFKAFLNYALDSLNADYIATGHYARIKHCTNSVQLLKGLDPNKDQSYFLHALNQQQLAKSLFPIGALNKPHVRAIAKNLDLITHDKKDSTGICFIGERKFKNFLEQYIPNKPGNIIDETENIIGKHSGLMYYTIGQRQGLNLGGLKNYNESPWYVAQKDITRNTLLVVQNSYHPLLLKKSAEIINHSFINSQTYDLLEKNNTINITAKARYRQNDEPATLSLINDKIFVEFASPQRAITPGQFVVFYDSHDPNICLGGGAVR